LGQNHLGHNWGKIWINRDLYKAVRATGTTDGGGGRGATGLIGDVPEVCRYRLPNCRILLSVLFFWSDSNSSFKLLAEISHFWLIVLNALMDYNEYNLAHFQSLSIPSLENEIYSITVHKFISQKMQVLIRQFGTSYEILFYLLKNT
jgi:hypothetical protein